MNDLQKRKPSSKVTLRNTCSPSLPSFRPETGLPVNDLPDVRLRLFRDFIQRASNQQAREELINLTYTYMWGIVRGNFHPLAKFNAMLVVGALNESEARTGGGSPSPPLPLAKALQDMIVELENPQQNDAVRVAAMIGIQRHAKLDGQQPASNRMAGSKKVDLVGKVAKILYGVKPVNRSQVGHNWLRRMAIETIGYTHDPGVGNKNAKEFARILADESESRSMRLAAGLAYSRLEFDNAPPIPTADIFTQFAHLSLQSTRDHIDALTAEEDARIELSATPMSGEGEFGGMSGFSEEGTGYSSESSGEGYGTLGGAGGPDPFALPGEEGLEGTGGEGFGGEDAGLKRVLAAARQYKVDNIARSLVNDLRTTELSLRGRQPASKGLSGFSDPKTSKGISDLASELKSIYTVVKENREDIETLKEELEGAFLKLEEVVVVAAPIATETGGAGIPTDEGGLPGDGGALPGDDGGLPGDDTPPAKPAETGLPGGLPG